MAVLGAGAWGTAVAATFAKAGVTTRIWGRDMQVCDAINARAENSRYLPGVALPDTLHAVHEMRATLEGAEAVAIVVPSRSVRSVARQMAEYLPKDVPVAVCAKGIEAETGLLIDRRSPRRAGGNQPSLHFRPDFCQPKPRWAIRPPPRSPSPSRIATGLRLTKAPRCVRRCRSRRKASAPMCPTIWSGWRSAARSKNVIAIACGMMTGAGFAENTRAALITRGVDEMKALAEALGGRRETVTGLSGMGDLTLTCSSPTSRNMSLGLQLGQGIRREACFDGQPVVVEGEMNARSVTDLARRVGVAMPISEAVRTILHNGAELGETFAALWSRPIEGEPRTLDLSFDHPATDMAIQQLAERFT